MVSRCEQGLATMIRFLVPALLIVFSLNHYGRDLYGTRTSVFLAFCTLWIAGSIGRRIHWSAGLALAWVLGSGIYVFGSPVSPYLAFGDGAVLTFDAITASAFVAVLLPVMLVLSLPRGTLGYLLAAFGWLCYLDSGYVVVQWVWGADLAHRGGLLGNASLNGSLIACCYPILIWAMPWRAGILPALLPVVAILASRSNVAWGALLAGMGTPILVHACRRSWDLVQGGMMSVALLGVGGYLALGAKFADTNGRFPVWFASLSWWRKHANPWMGTGLGTYYVLGPSLQRAYLPDQNGHLLWMHNDWLQILFELGWVGLALLVLMGVWAIARAVRNGRLWLASSLAAYAVVAAGNFPMHVPTLALLGILLVVCAFRSSPSASAE
jgi:O-antigen ligase